MHGKRRNKSVKFPLIRQFYRYAFASWRRFGDDVVAAMISALGAPASEHQYDDDTNELQG